MYKYASFSLMTVFPEREEAQDRETAPFFCFHLFFSTIVAAAKDQVSHHNHMLEGVYMVEFSSQRADIVHSHEFLAIKNHLKLIGYDEERLMLRTSTMTDLFHGHSFEVRGKHDRILLEKHLSLMPDFYGIHKVFHNK